MTSTVHAVLRTVGVHLAVILMFWEVVQVQCQIPENVEFSPTVTANCERGEMTIMVITEFPFHGIVHIEDFRRFPCISHGTGSTNTTLKISLLADPKDRNYCGIQTGQGSSQARSVTVAVRRHKTLEVFDDKFFFINCGKSGFLNSRNKLSHVYLNFMEDYKKVTELTVGHQYILRAGISHDNVNDHYDIKVRKCLSFAANVTEVDLIDSQGCPKTSFLSKFQYNKTSKTADSVLYSTFKFPNTHKIHVQCDIVLCKGSCSLVNCQQSVEALPQPLPQTRDQGENIQLLASTTVFVVEPGHDISALAVTDCTEWRFPWLIGLCICLAILLLVMLIVNIFLCSSLTCTCTKTEVVDKEPSEMEDYDPYRVGWAPSSHYGSRTSLNKPYISGGSTLNSISRSMGSGSDHYAIVHSRPNSRYSHHSSKEPLHRGPGSTISNGQYSSRI